MMSKMHYYMMMHISPWPLLTSLMSFNTFMSMYLFFKFSYPNSLNTSTLMLLLTSIKWWKSCSMEFNLKGSMNFNLENSVKYSMILFILSEVLFFFSFFWSYFHFYLAPLEELGLIWPPYSVLMFNFIEVPLINTMILLSSGMTITMSHNFLIKNQMKEMSNFLTLTVILGLLFTMSQYMEYNSSFFSIGDSSFGSTFFVLTGFHGIHVLIGSLFLMMMNIQLNKIFNNKNMMMGFELASWYWHFVDVVWIFLYFLIYYMNN